MQKEWLTYVVKEAEDGRVLRSVMRGGMKLSGRMLQKLTRSDGFRVNGKKTFLNQKVQAGDQITICIAEEEQSTVAPVEMPLQIAYEDAHVLVLNKPPGIEVHPPEQRAKFRPTLAHGVAYYFEQIGLQAKVRPLHRLDKDTTGLVVFVKSAFAHQALDRQLRKGGIKRTYLAIVHGTPAEQAGTITGPIARDPDRPMLRCVAEGGEEAITHYRVIQSFREPNSDKPCALLALRLETGRTHQIRVHLRYQGWPIFGDDDYGGYAESIDRQALHAASVHFAHVETGQPVEVKAALPEDMARLLPETIGPEGFDEWVAEWRSK
ncbi:RluA family pseudouridine synthase [Heliophilum fasciatum]|uniref:Pseudouridine synthase n=1 Tax=Heliophilum fasciatum TaxID=35700 RepID=A0A4R2RLW1_9FIRM|nr:RluA family pseudouridine synthase [Heliophilum fasciatum]MCW2277593.1 RluA family pseudouridine synthase [Heliophilum fasciatum]TCP64942.1 tRNA pseudouridine32 synthase/23S rRNA pseudouridine746 synthase/23S rRNA pseudouridine1911/1915/1917 synthase [Heliophilum fasciatum]